MSPTTIVIADDHPIVRAGVRLMVEAMAGFDLVGEASNSKEVFQLVGKLQPDVLVLDLWLGKDDGLEVLRELRRNEVPVRVLIYSMNDEELYGLRSIEAGADGYLMKDRGLDVLGKAIEKIASGHRYMGDGLADKAIDAAVMGCAKQSGSGPMALQALTNRELHVFRLIGRGMSTGEIARSLGISPKTIGAHRENMKNKLNAGSAEELVRLAVTYLGDHGN